MQTLRTKRLFRAPSAHCTKLGDRPIKPEDVGVESSVSSSSNSVRKFGSPDVRHNGKKEPPAHTTGGFSSKTSSLNQPDVLQWQLAHRLAGRGMDGVEHRGRHHADRRLADTA